MIHVLIEAVDPEERKLRLHGLLQYSSKMRDLGRMAREWKQGWDRSHGNTSKSSSHEGSLGNDAQRKQYDYLHRGVRARAIIQKFTGKDYKVDSLDWSGGNIELGSGRPSWKRKADAHVALRQYTYGRHRRGLVMPTRDKSVFKGNWLRRVRNGDKSTPTKVVWRGGNIGP